MSFFSTLLSFFFTRLCIRVRVFVCVFVSFLFSASFNLCLFIPCFAFSLCGFYVMDTHIVILQPLVSNAIYRYGCRSCCCCCCFSKSVHRKRKHVQTRNLRLFSVSFVSYFFFDIVCYCVLVEKVYLCIFIHF